jgi:hypothetical protein
MAGDRVARSVPKFIYIRVGGQIRWIYPPLNKPKTLCANLFQMGVSDKESEIFKSKEVNEEFVKQAKCKQHLRLAGRSEVKADWKERSSF